MAKSSGGKETRSLSDIERERQILDLSWKIISTPRRPWRETLRGFLFGNYTLPRFPTTSRIPQVTPAPPTYSDTPCFILIVDGSIKESTLRKFSGGELAVTAYTINPEIYTWYRALSDGTIDPRCAWIKKWWLP